MNTRKFPRTLQEAFGPHTSNHIEERPMDREDRPVVAWSCAALCFLAVLLLLERTFA